MCWARWYQFISSHRFSLSYILILSFNQNLRLVSGLLPLDFPAKIWCAFIVFPIVSISVLLLMWPDILPTCFS
jgi:hypothetical protein